MRLCARITGLFVAVALVTTACGGDDDDEGVVDPVRAAEAKVETAQEDLTTAQADYDSAAATFCSDAADYISAVDEYGGVFNDSAATVGDVKTAGRDLAAPKDEVADSAAATTTAREGVTSAQANLTAAETELAAAQAEAAQSATTVAGETTTGGTTTTTSTTIAPLPAATVSRVEEAESDLAGVSAAITDETPLREAGTAFNAAAFALETAWLRLFADAGCLTDEQYLNAVVAVSQYTNAVQTALQTAGLYDGPVDGVYGPSTVAAVEELQRANDLPVTGLVDQATAAALEAAVLQVGGNLEDQALAHTAAVQSTLKLAGYWTGPVDGEWTPELTDTLMTLQTDLGVEPTGIVDPATLAAVEQAIADAQTPETTTSAPESATTSTVVP
jgi:peptidoglycan hydrolase-like protein with peptidoglycan-binding domain